ncbi:SAM-dependent methlyltransferase [Sediminicola sp. YIK13]|uniref:methyltransferase domain-containing protein n=1 Tax=Sediminicola sp. YIK13 TaxID=1453352 RepID=UPI00071F481C|nr:methyltransferase domain-containing protein [Sediminicola sp. YIK13]ALM06632.1 SAM-dependent methlyltransferase [Sediminicola sp. YIK13]
MKLTKDFWEDKYKNGDLKWDIGYVSTPLKEYIDQLEHKEMKILIPGAGNGYEVTYLHQLGFTNVYVADLAEQPLKRIETACSDFPKDRLIQVDFFDLEQNGFDLILEQTFFCALPPIRRIDYVQKMATLLKPSGKIVGLFFDFPLTEEGPPFGGSKTEYENLFKPSFQIKVLERAYNSIQPRKDKELFFIFEK